MKRIIILSFVISILISLTFAQRNDNSLINKSNIVWTSPSNNSSGSMPLGNGDIGINLWAEKSGDICFYISKTDAWEENCRLLKIGKVKINISPNPFRDNEFFTQTLNLYDGKIEIQAGKNLDAVKFSVWVDANNPVIHFDADIPEKTIITASTEIWRTQADTAKKLESSDLHNFPEIYGLTITQPDKIMDIPGKVVWYHLNPEKPGFKMNLVAQGLDKFGLSDPLKDRIFGACISGDKFTKKDIKTLVSNTGAKRNLIITVLTEQPSNPEKWLSSLNKISTKSKSVKGELFQQHKEWWHKFWDRSYIYISCDDTITTPMGIEKQGDVLTRGYTLQRFINACGSRGKFPVKFNGSIFTVDYKDRENFADYRQWGTGYWWQNTRLPVISMPTSGDFDLMQPLFKMYFNQLPLAKYRTEMAFKHKGAFFPECIYFWGSVFTKTWGKKNIDDMPDRIQESGWHKYEWVCGPELVSMMYDYYLYTQDKKFVKEVFLPLAEEVILFFEQHYKIDEAGHLKFEPSQALETWWKCTNSLPEVAGMHYVVKKIKLLPQDNVPESLKRLVLRMEKILPPIPIREFENKKMLAPAEKFENKLNVENPELYAVYPFILYGLGKPDMDLAINAFQARTDKGYFGWRQDDIFAAFLGLKKESKSGILERAKNRDKSQRFPAFWGPNYDWTPDQDHGGVLLKTLQVMLLQCDEKEIRLLPSWPKEWDVNFKLMAPFNTTIECIYKNGKIEKLEVLPKSRKKDIILPSDL